jgi:hypothetical protein
VDDNLDGQLDLVISRTYGRHGILASYSRVGSFDTAIIYIYDEMGRWTASSQFEDGELASRSVNTYGPSGLRSSMLVEDFRDEHSVSVVREHFFYDEFDQVNRVDIDRDDDGTIDGRGNCKSKPDGRFVFEEMDTDLDGIIDYAEYYEYDELDRLVRTVRDDDGDGEQAPATTSYSYECATE